MLYIAFIAVAERKIIIEKNPNSPIFDKDMAHGNRKAISKSNMMNNIATR